MPQVEENEDTVGLRRQVLERLRVARYALIVLAFGCLVLALLPKIVAVDLLALFLAVLVTWLLTAVPLPQPQRQDLRLRTTAAAIWPDTSMKMMAEALAAPCFIIDRHAILRYANKAAVDSFGSVRPGDPVSFKLRVPELLALIDAVGRGEEGETVRYAERGPTERVFDATVTPIRIAEGRRRPDFLLVLLSNKTEVVRIERMRADFIANASHELRTPLASLTGFVQTLLGPARNDEVNRERFLKIMLEQGERMARLIDDLLSLSRIEMKSHVRPDTVIDIGEIVQHSVNALLPLAKSSGTSILVHATDRPAMVRGDWDELVQVMHNLIENALKYGRAGGTVDVSIRFEDGGDGQPGVAVSVKDDGPGIDAAHIPRLTERFYRVDVSRSRAQKGTGLGLAIVKHIVARHRGRLSITSEKENGSVFCVWLERATVTENLPALELKEENQSINMSQN
ncbi:Alkaline phosphatase synthesis sensor protein PhoR [Hartmannibacter diazotrophicus]|uniref:histidine kinase n=1 Tax=Hartmannibacter diazotrophicus TaxID=1482074 RepID=A0A2C9D1R6_9HYPH|nr:ATP-binding protein [Hartmannibacter diazotrophicus]SON54098.1 Alkaline phosphatase synthesis sensor protein PhoR [Hartmannibacter diazotrophicus]